MEATVLIIEDHIELCENAAEILGLANYNVLVAYNGKKGLELAKKHTPDLIICDIMMPELDGFGVLRAVQNNPDLAAIPFVFLTAKSEFTDFRKAMDLGADDYLVKPFNGDDLLKIVDARIKKNRMVTKTKVKNGHAVEMIEEEIPVKESIADQGIKRKLRKKDPLFIEGDNPAYFYTVVSGKIKTVKTNYWGKEYITEIYKEGDFLGHCALLEGTSYKESAIAIEDSEVMQIPRSEFSRLLVTDKELSISYIKSLTKLLSGAEDKLLKLAYDSARKRLAEALLYIGSKYHCHKNNEWSFPIHRDILSSVAGLSPESVSRNLTDLRNEGLIETDNGIIRITNPDKLVNLKW
jgi:CheY-like chemotaxis protein/CRP-like cAMP-binding protein